MSYKLGWFNNLATKENDECVKKENGNLFEELKMG